MSNAIGMQFEILRQMRQQPVYVKRSVEMETGKRELMKKNSNASY